MNEELWSLPQNWVWSQAGEIADIIGGGTPSSKDETNFCSEGGIPWITPADLTGYESRYISNGRRNLTDKGYQGSGAQLMPAGTVLFSSRAPIGYCAIATEPISTNQGFKSLVLKDGLSSEFIYYYLKASKSYAESLSSGTTFRELSGSRMAQLAVPVAPAKEQKRIVAKLDALMARSIRAREELARIPRLIERYKQAVLTAAFSGQLTADWREVNKNCSLPPKPERLEKRLRAIKPLNNLDASILPNSWAMTILGAVVECLDSMRKPINKEERQARVGDIPYYGANGQVGWIDDYLFNEDLVVVVEDETFLGRTKPFSYKITGKSWVNNHAHVLRPTEAVHVDYLNYSLMFYPFIPLTTGTTGRRKLTQGTLMGIAYPWPPLEEQAEIVERIETCFAAIDRTFSEGVKAEALCNRLEQATLAKAFQGELVPQDPNDEPASVLLERIRAERAEQPSKGRKKAKVSG